MNIPIKNKNQVTPLVGISYALPVIPILILFSSNNVLSGIYATYHGISLAAVATVMLIGNLFDGVTDPTIGYLSDRYHARTGSRRPFVICGAVMLIPSAWFLLNPGEGVTFIYFLSWYLLFYLAMTLFNIPHLTWGGEISPVSEHKTKTFAYRNYGGYAGMILFSLVPMMPFTEGSKITPETMRYLVIIAAVILLPTLYRMLRYVPNGVHNIDQAKKPENPFRAIATLRHNKPLLWFLLINISHTVATAFYIGLLFMMVNVYLGLGDYYVYLLLFHLIAATVAMKPAMALIARTGKLRALKICKGISALAYLFLPLALLNNDYSLHFLVIFFSVFALSSSINNVSAYSILSDVADYGTLKSGIDRSATYFSLHSLTNKLCLGFGISLSIGLAALFGFDPTAESQAQGDQVYWGLTLSMGVIPIILCLVAMVFVPKIYITEQRHEIIRKRLDERLARADIEAL